MSKIRILAGVGAMLGAFFFATVPAFAEYESTNGQTTGVAKATQGSEFTFGKEVSVKCPITEEIKAQWRIQVKGQVKQQQALAKEGSNLQIQVKNWGKCEELIGATKQAAEVGECDFQLQQEAGTPGAVIGKSCVIKAGVCTIQIPAAMEIPGSGVGINDGLRESKLENKGKEEQSATLSMTKGGYNQVESTEGMVAYLSGTLCPLKQTEAGTLKGEFLNQDVVTVPLQFKKEGTGEFNPGNTQNGHIPQVFTFPSQTFGQLAKFSCEKSKFTGMQAATATTAEVNPATYEECKETVSGNNATVTTENCRYKYIISGREPGTTTRFWGRMQIINSGGTCKIKFVSTGCKIFIPQQADPTSMVEYINLAGGNPKELEVLNNIGPLTYEVEERVGCNGFTANGRFRNGLYSGGFTLLNVLIGT